VTAVAPTVGEARERAYAATAPIDWEGMQMRHDIASSVADTSVATAGEAR
jgi:phosphoribosylamine-glycine ligase